MNKSELSQFEGYFSRLKLSVFLSFMCFAFASICLDSADEHTYFRWVSNPNAAPIRFIMATGVLIIIVVTVKFFIVAFQGRPFFKMSNAHIEIYMIRVNIFEVQSLKGVSVTDFGNYVLSFGDKKIFISALFARNPKIFKHNMLLLKESLL